MLKIGYVFYTRTLATIKTNMKIILIPGLGYDYQIFKNLNLMDFETECLNWIEPKPKENIHEYSQRIFKSIENDSTEITIIGHSLGGIVAQEIASIKKIHKIILISSIKTRKEMPFFFKIIKPLNLEKLFTKEICIKTVNFWGKNHGFETKNDKELFKNMVGKQTNKYLQWALKELSLWKEPKIPNSTRIIQIHGSNDKTFPIKKIRNPDIVIENGSHIVVYKQAKRISEILTEQIKKSG